MKAQIKHLFVFSFFALIACAPNQSDSGRIDFIAETKNLHKLAALSTCNEVLATPADALAKSAPAQPAEKSEPRLVLVSSEQVVTIYNKNKKSTARALVKTTIQFDAQTNKYVPESKVTCKDLTNIEEPSIEFTSAPIPVVWTANTHIAEQALTHKITLHNPKLSKGQNSVTPELESKALAFDFELKKAGPAETTIKNPILSGELATAKPNENLGLTTEHKQSSENGEIEVTTHTRAQYQLKP